MLPFADADSKYHRKNSIVGRQQRCLQLVCILVLFGVVFQIFRHISSSSSSSSSKTASGAVIHDPDSEFMRGKGLRGAAGRVTDVPKGVKKAKDGKSGLRGKVGRKKPQLPMVICETSKGSVRITVRNDWSPNGAARFLELVDAGYFTQNVFYRVPPLQSNPIFQFGVQPNKELAERFQSRIPDDPAVACNGSPTECRVEGSRTTGIMRGMIGFGGSGTDSRTSHMWIVRQDTQHLGAASWETPVAEVVDGMDLLDDIAEVGDLAPWGNGPDPGKIADDPTFSEEGFPGEYLKAGYPDVDFFESCQRA